MRPGAAPPAEYRVSLTRVCLRSGSVVLPLAARTAFEGREEVDAVDLERDRAHRLELQRRGRLAGLETFFEDHALDVNDTLVLRPLGDGRVALLARAHPRSARRDAQAVRRAVDALLAGGPPRSLEELRGDHDLADDAPLRAALEREPRLARRAGRWGLRHEPAPAAGADGRTHVVPVEPAPRGTTDAALNSADADAAASRALDRARSAFRALGYEVATGRDGTLRLTTPGGRRNQHVLVRVLGEGERPDWNALLYALREAGAARLAIVGDVRDLHPLERPARGARATLWSWDGLARIESLRASIPIGPVDLAPSFEEGGMVGAGIERFEAGIRERLEAQGAFSQVLDRLAGLRAPTVFSVAELGLDDALPRETVVRVLDTLSMPPFQWAVHLGPGEFALRHAVPDGLDQLANYAATLRERLPDRRRARVRGADADAMAQLLGPEELAMARADGDDEHR